MHSETILRFQKRPTNLAGINIGNKKDRAEVIFHCFQEIYTYIHMQKIYL